MINSWINKSSDQKPEVYAEDQAARAAESSSSPKFGYPAVTNITNIIYKINVT
jgi:hypothetical protein